MQEKLFLLGIILIFLGVFITIISSLLSGSDKIEYGFGGFIGPIPFGWASNKRMLYSVMTFSLIVLILFLILSRKLI